MIKNLHFQKVNSRPPSSHYDNVLNFKELYSGGSVE